MQQFLLPLNLEEFVSENHISRVLNDITEIVDSSFEDRAMGTFK